MYSEEDQPQPPDTQDRPEIEQTGQAIKAKPVEFIEREQKKDREKPGTTTGDDEQ